MRPGQTWQRVFNFGTVHHFTDPVTLLKKLPCSGGKRWLVLDLVTGLEREERFSTRDSWRQV